MTQKTFDPGSRAHRFMAHLREHPGTHRDEMMIADGVDPADGRARRKTWYLLNALAFNGMVRVVGPLFYVLTTTGAEALAQLDAGAAVSRLEPPRPFDAAPKNDPPPRPNVRVFGR